MGRQNKNICPKCGHQNREIRANEWGRKFWYCASCNSKEICSLDECSPDNSIQKAQKSFKAWSKSTAFVVSITDNVATLVSGKATSIFLNDCTEIARRDAIEEGYIGGSMRNGSVCIECSEHIPENIQQKFRNVWNLRN